MSQQRRSLYSQEDTIALGQELASQLQAGDVVILSGQLGAGKTFLTKGIAHGLGVHGAVSSPTYVLARFHPPKIAQSPGLIHVDLYRLLDSAIDIEAELDSLDLDSELDRSVVVVEWGEGIAETLSSRCLHIQLTHQDHEYHRVAEWKWMDND